MTVSLRDARDHRSDRVWIERVYRDYLDDLGLLNTGVFPALGEVGHREPDQVRNWFGDPSATLLTILDSMNPAGFALVARQTHASRTADYRMADFFIAREARRRGVGQAAVRLILDRFAGKWEVVEYSRNPRGGCVLAQGDRDVYQGRLPGTRGERGSAADVSVGADSSRRLSARLPQLHSKSSVPTGLHRSGQPNSRHCSTTPRSRISCLKPGSLRTSFMTGRHAILKVQSGGSKLRSRTHDFQRALRVAEIGEPVTE